MDRAATAELLMTHIRKESAQEVQKLMVVGTTGWREILRYEFPLLDLMETVLQYEIMAPRLLNYEITTMSCLHLAALGGQIDILILFLERDVPVDIALASGTTPLHLACFAGQLDTVKLLHDIYKADLSRTDRYGWSALHYAATEGHLGVCEALVESGICTSSRDKDGTSAAYRALANNFDDVANYLMSVSNDEELLNIGDDEKEGSEDEVDLPLEPLYATVHKPPLRSVSSTGSISSSGYEEVRLRRPASQRQSRPLAVSTLVPAPGQTKSLEEMEARRREIRKSSVRRLIRRELERVFLSGESSDDEDPTYERPEDVQLRAQRTGASTESDYIMTPTLTSDMLSDVIREEFKRYKDTMSPGPQTAAHGFEPQSKSKMIRDDVYEDYDDLYASLIALGPAPPPPTVHAPPTTQAPPNVFRRISDKRANIKTQYTEIEVGEDNYGDEPLEFVGEPPLPPRNPNMLLRAAAEQGRDTCLHLPATVPSSEPLREAMEHILPQISENWKCLARSLPLEPSPEQTEKRVEAIERHYPGDKQKQAAMLIAEWRLNKGPEADVEHFIAALRRSGLANIVDDVERVTSEFSA